MRTLVLGGTRFLGVEVVNALLRAGHDVVAFHRGSRQPEWSAPVEQVIGDRDVAEDRRKLASLDVDAVVDLSAYNAAQTESMLATLPTAPRYVHVSTLNVYNPEPTLPWPEHLDYGPHPLWGRYAVEKIGCELALRDRRPAPLSTVVLRLPLVLGPGNFIPREEFVLNRLLDGEVILLPGDGQAVHQYVWVKHAAAALARAAELEPASFQAFNVASRRCNTSLEGFVQVCAEVSGTTPRIRTVGGGATGEDLPVFNGVDCVFPFSNENTIGDISAADTAGLIEPYLPLHDMIRAALEYLTNEPGRRTWERTDAERRVLNRFAVSGGVQ